MGLEDWLTIKTVVTLLAYCGQQVIFSTWKQPNEDGGWAIFKREEERGNSSPIQRDSSCNWNVKICFEATVSDAYKETVNTTGQQ